MRVSALAALDRAEAEARDAAGDDARFEAATARAEAARRGVAELDGRIAALESRLAPAAAEAEAAELVRLREELRAASAAQAAWRAEAEKRRTAIEQELDAMRKEGNRLDAVRGTIHGRIAALQEAKRRRNRGEIAIVQQKINAVVARQRALRDAADERYALGERIRAEARNDADRAAAGQQAAAAADLLAKAAALGHEVDVLMQRRAELWE